MKSLELGGNLYPSANSFVENTASNKPSSGKVNEKRPSITSTSNNIAPATGSVTSSNGGTGADLLAGVAAAATKVSAVKKHFWSK